MDRGLWITWYDQPEQGREQYLQWLHNDYMPRMLKRPGWVWGAHYAEVPNSISEEIKAKVGASSS